VEILYPGDTLNPVTVQGEGAEIKAIHQEYRYYLVTKKYKIIRKIKKIDQLEYNIR